MSTSIILSHTDEDAFQGWQSLMIYKQRRQSADVDATVAPVDAKQQDVLMRQEQLFQAVDDGSVACSKYLFKRLDINEANRTHVKAAVPKLSLMYTGDKLLALSPQDEKKIAKSLNAVTAGEAATPSFWAACHATWISQGAFVDLADCFLNGDKLDSEARTRNFLRRTAGLEPVRGKTSVLQDCPIARAWWRRRMAHDIAAHSHNQITVEDAHRVLHKSAVWQELTGLSVSQLTAITAPHARAAAIVALASQPKIGRPECQGAFRAVARLSKTFSLDMVAWSHLLSTAQAGIKAA